VSLGIQRSCAVIWACAVACASWCPAQTTLLPDLIARQADLLDRVQQTVGTPPNVTTLLRVSNSGVNLGPGTMQIEGLTPANPDGSQDVIQRIYRDDGSNFTRLAGRFTYHAGHRHFHLDNWAVFRIREVLPDDAVGAVLRSGRKASYCLLDSAAYDLTLPNARQTPAFLTCNTMLQGISVGWMDTYGKNLPGQDIDITGLPDGTYWLETEIDPDNVLLEKDETNNTARVKVTIANAVGTRVPPDAYEPNDTPTTVKSMPIQTLNSANLGPCAPTRTVDTLTIDSATDTDVFRFYCAGTGTSDQSVRIEFIHSSGDLNLQLLDDEGNVLANSSGLGNIESISLAGRPRGWYMARVVGFAGARNPYYRLIVDPPSGDSTGSQPTVRVTSPGPGDHAYVHGIDAVLLTWESSDADNDPTWVTLWFNSVPELDGREITTETLRLLPGEQGFGVLNSAHIPPGTWWVYAQITDGGSVTGAWSQGTITLMEEHCHADLNHDGVVDLRDLDVFLAAFAEGNPSADINEDDFLSFEDFDHFIEHLESGC